MKTVLITGTSKSIGLETALAFGREGYKVFATMRNPEGATDLKQKIKTEPLDITISKMDVDSDASVKQCMDAILKENGSIDVLVNNAGIERHGSIEEMPMDDFQAIINTNYLGILRSTKAVSPQMRKNKKGCIINIASVAGHIANSPLGGYAGSNHSARMRYVSDSSYWVYLLHLPLTIIIPALIVDWNIPGTLKFIFVMTSTAIICFVTYHYLVRNSFIGKFLNRRTYPRQISEIRKAHEAEQLKYNLTNKNH